MNIDQLDEKKATYHHCGATDKREKGDGGRKALTDNVAGDESNSIIVKKIYPEIRS